MQYTWKATDDFPPSPEVIWGICSRNISITLTDLTWDQLGWTQKMPGFADTNGASRCLRHSKFALYIQNSKSEGVNRPGFRENIVKRMCELEEIWWFWGLDKFWARSGNRYWTSRNPSD